MRQKENGKILSINTIIILITLVLLIVIGNIIVIGEKISNISRYMSWAFYTIVGLLIIWTIVLPIIRVIISPPLTRLQKFRSEEIKKITPEETTTLIRNLRKQISLTHEENRKFDEPNNNRVNILDEIYTRCHKEMEQAVKDAAVSNFAITAISQNGTFDFIASIAINLKLINQVIRKLGVRPSYPQLFKLYASVLSASLVITTLDDMLDDIEYEDLLGNIGGKALGVFIPSITNGLMNALVTLRIGYTTIEYLENGNKSFDRTDARKLAIKAARKQILSIGKEGMIKVGSVIRKRINGVSVIMYPENTQGKCIS